jgi:hypothetical protein
VTYNLYQQLGVDGLRGLANFNVDSGVSYNQQPHLTKASTNLTLSRNGAKPTAE